MEELADKYQKLDIVEQELVSYRMQPAENNALKKNRVEVYTEEEVLNLASNINASEAFLLHR